MIAFSIVRSNSIYIIIKQSKDRDSMREDTQWLLQSILSFLERLIGCQYYNSSNCCKVTEKWSFCNRFAYFVIWNIFAAVSNVLTYHCKITNGMFYRIDSRFVECEEQHVIEKNKKTLKGLKKFEERVERNSWLLQWENIKRNHFCDNICKIT